MIYRVIGILSDVKEDSLQLGYVELLESGGKWSFELLHTKEIQSSTPLASTISSLNVTEFFKMRIEHSETIAREINSFIDEHQLHFKIALVSIGSVPLVILQDQNYPVVSEDGSLIATRIQLPVVTELMNTSMAVGGSGDLNDTIANKLIDVTDHKHYSLITIALLGVLRWREEISVAAGNAGTYRDSVGGGMWLG